MRHQRVHPTDEQLNAFSSGRLPPTEASGIELHIAKCDQCCQTLLTLSPDDTFVDLLHAAGRQHVSAKPTQSPQDVESDQTCVPESLQDHPRYEIVELIGTGGMGDVYKVRHRVMNRIVALKIINRRLILRNDAVERFRREVHAAAQLSHPNIVAAHDAEQADDLHFLVMEYVEGVNLAELVEDRGALSVDDACEHIRQAANGLEYAHQQGMVHRDIKPQNLMLAENGATKILDFGLATLTPGTREDDDATGERSGLTSAGSIMGTPDYISPEQAGDAHSADIRSDIYSLGGTLYFLLSGRPPFLSGSITQKLQSHADSEPDPLDSLCPAVPTEVADIVSRMMAKNPNDRLQTPAEVAKALAPFAAQPNAPRAAQPATEHRSLSVVLAALAVAALVILAGIVYAVTDKGTLVVNATAEDVEVVIRRGGEEIQVIDTVTGSKGIRLPTGKYELSLRGKQNKFTIDCEHFSLTRGSEKIATVTFKPNEQPRSNKGHEAPNGNSGKADQLASIAAINELGGSMRFDKSNPALVTVRFDGERFNDSHLIHVKRLDRIETLYLPGTSVTNAGLQDHVQYMKTLVNLYLPGTKVTENGLRHLVALDKLRILYVSDLPISDAGLVHLTKLRKLVGLSLDRTMITDAGLKRHISQMRSLRMLFLRGTKITDVGLASLHQLNLLHHLDLKDTKVTPEGVRNFQEAFPECKVILK